MAHLLPGFVETVESGAATDEAGVAITEAGVDDPLLGAEAEAVRGAGAQRRREFVAGRAYARRALLQLGAAADALPRTPEGPPRWPHGVVGSITHSHGYVAASVAFGTHVRGLGIDAEPHRAVHDVVARRIASTTEHARLASLRARHPEVHWDRVLFSAKEAIYKASFPLTHRVLRFAEVEVEFSVNPPMGQDLSAERIPSAGRDVSAERNPSVDRSGLPARGTFSARIAPSASTPDRIGPVTGRWSCGALVLTSATIPLD